ncbi:MAG: hypothetical protein ABI678_25190, partial [Kofleriaceae bacterium]
KNITGYTMTIDVASQPGAAAKITAKMLLALAFKDSASPTTRDAYMKKIDLDLDAAGQRMVMKLDNDEMSVTQGAEAMTFKRGDHGAIDVAAMVDLPFTSVDFAHDKITIKSNNAHPFTSMGGDMLDDAMVLFPDLPEGAVQPGHTWKVVRTVSIGSNLGKTTVNYDFKYEGDGTCPSGAAACALLSFTASSKDVTVDHEGTKIKVGYGFAGKVYLDTAKGIIDESRVHMEMDVDAQGQKLPMAGTFVIVPNA